LRILLVNKFAEITGGADRHCLDLARVLEERGHAVSLLASGPEPDFALDRTLVSSNVTHHDRDGLGGLKAARVAASSLWNPSAASAATGLISAFKPDVVHLHKLYPQLSVAPAVVASRLGVPVVQTVHDYEFVSASPVDHTGQRYDQGESRLSYRVLNTTLFQAKRWFHVPAVCKWISVSRSVRDVYARHGLVSAVIPNFTDPFKDPPRFADRDGVLYVGRLTPEKGVDHVIRSAELLPSLPHAIAGGGPMQAEVEAAEQRLPNLSFLGHLAKDQVDSRIADARLLVMPSLWQEPGPLTALEALAKGTPVIAYANGGLGEYVADSEGGLVVPPQSEELVRAVSALYADRELWGQASSRARAAAASTHSAEAYGDAIEIIYLSAIRDASMQVGRRTH
jgi:glycosyltransferase involved in cell wall biosynthesis